MSTTSRTETWKKSTASVSSCCVEVLVAEDAVHVRDSKNPGGPKLTFTNAEWDAFLVGARDGQFDR